MPSVVYEILLTTLFASFAPIAAQCVEEGPEPNDFSGVPTVAGCGLRVTGTLTAGDTDYYTVTASGAIVLTAYTSYGEGLPGVAAVDTIVEIRDGSDTLVSSDDDGGSGLFSYAGANIPASGIYYVVVRGFSPTTAGGYTLDITCRSPVIGEGAEPNNGPTAGGTPTAGACGSTHHGEIAVAADEDWYSFVHPGGNITITTGPGGALGGVALEDSIIEVFDAASVSVVPADDDGGEALYSSISSTLAAGLYYVKVTAFGTGTGYYNLRIGCGEPASSFGDVTYPAGAPPAGSAIGTLGYRASAPAGTRVRPRIGTTYSVDAAGLPAGAPHFCVLGLSLLPTPFPLSSVGGTGTVSVSPDATMFGVADAAGKARCCVPIPDNPMFIGVNLHFQVLNFAPLATTNVVSSVVANLGFL